MVAGDPKQKEGTLWAVNFFQLPNMGKFINADVNVDALFMLMLTIE